MSVYDFFGNLMPQSATPTSTVTGSAGSEDLFGSFGDDLLVGGGAGHHMYGGLGDDTYSVNSLSDVVVEGPGSGIDTVNISGTKGGGAIKGYQLTANVENLNTQAKITAIGNELANVITGGTGSQVLIGGAGDDVLTGGLNADTFVFGAGSGYDVITDFSHSDGDKIRITDYGFSTFAQVTSAMTQVGSDVVLQLSPTDAIKILNTTVDGFQASDFVLPIDTSKLQMTFDDEFNSLSLYNPQTDQGVWDTSFPFGASTGPHSKISHTRNQLQIYVDPGYGGSGATPLGINPFSTSNGVLTITANKTPTADLSQLFNYKYTSGLLTTAHSFYQQYGYFEMRAELPQGTGIWPAFWLLPKGGNGFDLELDAMENIGGNQVYATTHDVVNGVKVKTNTGIYVPDMTGYHTFGLLWTAKEMDWYIDGVVVFSLATPADMNRPMYLLTDLAVGGNFAGSPPAGFSSAAMNIDYIHAYAVDPNATAVSINDGVAPPLFTTLTGTASADNIIGTSSDDLLQGLDGNDTLNGELGHNTLDGGNGTDTASYADAGSGVQVSLAITGAQNTVGAGVDTLISIENLTGSNHNDVLTGDGGPNVIIGGAGDDVITGGGGVDTLSGGGGADTFVFLNVSDSPAGSPDTITDFKRSDHDHIDLSAIDANTTLAGDQAFTFVGTHAFSNHAGELRYSVDGSGAAHVLGDVNGDGVADIEIVLTHVSNLQSTDFVL